MGRILVVGNQTLGSPELFDVLTDRASADPECAIHVVVPQTPMVHYRHTVLGDRAETVAEHQLAVALDEFGSLDASLTGEIGHENPLTAVRRAVGAGTYDELVLSTFPEGISRWLGAGLTNQIERHVEIPVTHVISHIDTRRAQRRRYEEVVRRLGSSKA